MESLGDENPTIPQPAIHEATRLTDGTGVVEKGAEIDEAAAVNRRRNGDDVVVCGSEVRANRELAMKIEAAVGPWMRQQRHTDSAGARALPHFQQQTAPPVGHTFYETSQAKARRQR
jgi:hypothetical protein